MVDSHLLTMFQKNQIEISTFTAPKIAVKVGVSNQLQGKSLESSIALHTVNEGDLGQIPALTLDCGAIEYYIILLLVLFF
jgi:hypothetical protein